MSVTLTSPVEGLKVGDTYTGEREDWLVANGYASRPGPYDGLHANGVPATKDPTLAANREAPPVQGGDIDAQAGEDGDAILSFDKSSAHKNTPSKDVELEDPRLAVAPQARLVPAGLTDTTRVTHGEQRLLGDEDEAGDSLTRKINANAKVTEKAQNSDDADVLDVAPQADPRTPEAKAKEVEKSDKGVHERSEKALDKADSDIPETSINVGTTASDVAEERAEAAAAALEKAQADTQSDDAPAEKQGEGDGGQSGDGGNDEAAKGKADDKQ